LIFDALKVVQSLKLFIMSFGSRHSNKFKFGRFFRRILNLQIQKKILVKFAVYALSGSLSDGA
jgi:hypothetical protein